MIKESAQEFEYMFGLTEQAAIRRVIAETSGDTYHSDEDNIESVSFESVESIESIESELTLKPKEVTRPRIIVIDPDSDDSGFESF